MSRKPCDKISNNQGFEYFGEPRYPIAYKPSFETKKNRKKEKKTRTKRDHKKADPWLIKPFRRNLVMLSLGNQLIALP